MKVGKQNLILAHAIVLGRDWLFHLQHHVSVLPNFVGGRDNLGSSGFEVGVANG